MSKSLLLFDFDGVIVDSFPLAHEVVRMLVPTLTAEQYKAWFHGNVFAAVQNELGDFSLEDNHAHWNTHYAPRLIEQPPFDAIADALATLAERATLAVVSSATKHTIDRYLERHNLHHHFADVLGSELSTSKVAKIRHALGQYANHPTTTLMITDTLGDIREATEAGVRSVAVCWGWHDRDLLASGNPAALIDHPRDLTSTIDALLNA